MLSRNRQQYSVDSAACPAPCASAESELLATLGSLKDFQSMMWYGSSSVKAFWRINMVRKLPWDVPSGLTPCAASNIVTSRSSELLIGIGS